MAEQETDLSLDDSKITTGYRSGSDKWRVGGSPSFT